MDVLRAFVGRRWLNLRAGSVAVIAVFGATANAQSVFDSVRTANGYCQIRVAPPGGSNPVDLSYSACAVDRHPKRLGGPDIPSPTLGLAAGGDIFIAIRPDGTVDSALTRPWSGIGDSSFNNHFLDAIRRWRFEPPLYKGVPVRAGFNLSITSTSRSDTIAQHLEWRYISGERGQDTAIGRWVADSDRPPPLTDAQADSVYADVFRQLARLQVLLPKPSLQYCLIASPENAVTPLRIESVARKAFERGPSMHARAGCERDPQYLRLVLGRVYRTEHDRVVVFPAGDFLPAWPWGLDAKSWRSWSGRCVGKIFSDGHAAMACGVNPSSSLADRPLDAPTRPPWTDGDSVRVTILATRAGAFLVDTMRVVLAALPVLEQHAIVDSLMPCGDFAAYSDQADSVLIVHGPIGGSLDVTAVSHGMAAQARSSAGCQRKTSSAGPFVAFFLGGIGARPTAPVRVCIAGCVYTYDIDPERGILAASPIKKFRSSDLRHESQLGSFYQVRILLDHGPPDVSVFLWTRIGTGWPQSVGRMRHTSEGQWDWGVGFDGSYPEIEYWIYMFRRNPSAARPTGG